MGTKHVGAALGFVAIAVGAAWPAQGAGRPPLLTDRAGDVSQFVTVCPTGSGCLSSPATAEPDLDLLAADVTADAAGVTATVVVDDIAFMRSAATPVPAGFTHYLVTLWLGPGAVHLSGYRDTGTGATSFAAAYQENIQGMVPQAWNAANVTGAVDPAAGSISITVPFADLNVALAAGGRGPIGLGTAVTVWAQTMRGTPAGPASYAADGADNSGVAYTLGD